MAAQESQIPPSKAPFWRRNENFLLGTGAVAAFLLFYWFVRGIDSPLLGEYAIPAKPSLLSLIDAMDRLLINEDPAA